MYYSYSCKDITFDDIRPFWDKLWAGKTYEQHSAMSYLGGYLAWPPETVCYYGVFDKNNNIVGVNSCHDTGAYTVRSRGLWVDEQHRNNGLGRMLLNYAVAWTESQGRIALWSYPKSTAWTTYNSAGFEQQGPWITENGSTNAYAIKFL